MTKTNAEPAGDLLPAAALSIKDLASLAQKAVSITPEMLKAPPELIGVAKEIPIVLINGERAEAKSVAALFEAYRFAPERKTGQAEVQTLEAFFELTNRHKTGNSVIFADMDWKKPSLTAVIDYHEAKSAGAAAFGKHRVHYAYPLSEEWKKWVEMDGQPMKQSEFAYFLEDRVPELSAPTDDERIRLERDFATKIAVPSQLIELSRGLQVNIEARVKGVTTLQTGEGQIAWEESHTDGDGKPLKVPGIFILSIAPFFMGDKVRIPVRLRYRAAAGAVIWFYQIYRPDQFITEHVRSTLFEARQKTDLPAFEGKPEMSL